MSDWTSFGVKRGHWFVPSPELCLPEIEESELDEWVTQFQIPPAPGAPIIETEASP